MFWIVFALALFSLAQGQLSVEVQQVGTGVEFKVKDEPGLNEVGFHYSLNQPLHGSEAANNNYEETHKSGDGYWHHHAHVHVNPGDTLYYWLFYEINRIGHVQTDMKWVAGQQNTQNTHTVPAVYPHTSPPSGNLPTNGRLVFRDDFNTIDRSKWTFDLTAWGGGNGEFQVYTDEPANTYVKNGVLYIKPTLTTANSKFSENDLYHGTMDVAALWGSCTYHFGTGCVVRANDEILPPVMSGRIQSVPAIKYGRVDLRAKLPKGDWLWPALWLMPRDNVYGTWPRSGEIDIIESRGNSRAMDGNKNSGSNMISSTLHFGPDYMNDHWNLARFEKRQSASWSDDFHTFSLDWTQDYMRTYVDGQIIMNFTAPAQGMWQYGGYSGTNPWNGHGKFSPFDQEVILCLAVGGAYFPTQWQYDHPIPWGHTNHWRREFYENRNQWLSTWNGEDAALKVDWIEMRQY